MWLLGSARFHIGAFHISDTLGTLFRHFVITSVNGYNSLAELCRHVSTNTRCFCGAIGEVYSTCDTIKATAIHHDDVQNGIHALSIFASSRVGNNLDALHHGGRHRLQNLLGVLGKAGIKVTVLVYLKTAVAFNLYIIFAINGYHRHLAQHIKHGLRFWLFIRLDIVTYAVDVLFNQLALGLNGYAF